MAHAMQPSSFRQSLDTVLDGYARNASRTTVVVPSVRMRDTRTRNAKKLKLFCSGFSGAEMALLLDMFDGDWGQPANMNLQHFCPAGCCKNEADFRKRMREALRLAFGGLFDVPLLYRWKNFDPAAEYLGRCTAIHNLLPKIWAMTHSCEESDLLTAWDEDSADLAPSFKQKVRASKVQAMLSSGQGGAAWCPACVFFLSVMWAVLPRELLALLSDSSI